MLIPESLIRCGISKDSILEAVGKKFGVSKENVQLESKTLSDLKHLVHC